jgi:hypothetical protein
MFSVYVPSIWSDVHLQKWSDMYILILNLLHKSLRQLPEQLPHFVPCVYRV